MEELSLEEPRIVNNQKEGNQSVDTDCSLGESCFIMGQPARFAGTRGFWT
jgi:hypothetical protein